MDVHKFVILFFFILQSCANGSSEKKSTNTDEEAGTPPVVTNIQPLPQGDMQPSSEPIDSQVAIDDTSGMTFFIVDDSNAKRPDCDDKRRGQAIYLKVSRQFQYCGEKGWENLDNLQGRKGDSCSVTSTDSGATIICENGSKSSITNGRNPNPCTVAKTGLTSTIACPDGTTASIADGQTITGPAGSSCSATKTGTIATIVCGSSTITVADGTNGQAGAQGADGRNGSSCSVSKSGGVASINCSDGSSVAINDGAAGTTGSSGAAGFNSIIKMTTEPAGVHCAGGGKKLESGLDNGDGAGVARNGVLEAGEVDATNYVCDGAAGASGSGYIGQSLYTSAGVLVGVIKDELTEYTSAGATVAQYFLIEKNSRYALYTRTNTMPVHNVSNNYFRRASQAGSLTRVGIPGGDLVYASSNCSGAGFIPANIIGFTMYPSRTPFYKEFGTWFNSVANLSISYSYDNSLDLTVDCSNASNNGTSWKGYKSLQGGLCQGYCKSIDVGCSPDENGVEDGGANGSACSFTTHTKEFPNSVAAGWYVQL